MQLIIKEDKLQKYLDHIQIGGDLTFKTCCSICISWPSPSHLMLGVKAKWSSRSCERLADYIKKLGSRSGARYC